MRIQYCLLGLLVLTHAGSAQTSAFEALTPQGLQPGSPAGSYALSGLDTINLYNGRMNFSVPLLEIGGRGEAGYMLQVPSSGEWVGQGYWDPNNACPGFTCWGFSQQGWANWDYRYRPAGIAFRSVSLNTTIPQPGEPCGGWAFYFGTLTRLTIGLGDGTEIELRDALTQGQVETLNGDTNTMCSDPTGHLGAFNRGKTWVSVDGSAATFIADNDVYDEYFNGGQLTGTLYLRDGRTYHFSYIPNGGQNGYAAILIDSITDRNGNQTIFTYNLTPASGFQSAFSITDPLGRTTTVEIGASYQFTDPAAGCSNPCTGSYDQISSPTGPNAMPRIYSIYRRSYWFDRMSSLQNATWPTGYQLFGGYASDTTLYDWAISKIVLPDGSSYQYHYNEYGEVARVDLPTGGAYEFDWTFGPGTGNQISGCPVGNVVLAATVWNGGGSSPNSACTLFAVYRRVNERREYANASNPSSWTRKTDYTVTELNPGTNVPGGDPLSLCASVEYCTQVNLTETDPTQGVLASEVHYFYGAASQAMFPAEPVWYSWWVEGREFHTERSSPQRIKLQTWQQRQTPSWWQASQSGTLGPEPADDSRVIQKNTLIDNGKMSQQSIYYTSDSANNVSDVCEYDFGNTSGSLGALLRQTHTNYLSNYNTLGSSPPVYLLSLVQDQEVYAASSCAPYSPTGTVVGQTSYSYDGTAVASDSGIVNNIYSTTFNARGNPTSVTRWRNLGGPSAPTNTMYDQAGNATQVTNPRGYATTYTYDGCGGRYAFPHIVKNALNEQTAYSYDCDLGKPTSIQDPNGTFTAPSFNDPLNRLTKLVRAQGNGLENQTTYGYPDPRTVSAQKDQYLDNDSTNGIQSSTIADGLGRTVQTQLVTPQGTQTTLTELDALGRAWKVHNPGYGNADPNVTTYTYDGQNRVANIAYADGSAEAFVWTGDTVLHTDPAGKKKQQQVDALGRIGQVVEDPSGSPVTTTYGYDAQDDLISVIRGSQTRSFGYNSVKELVWSSNPEVGQIPACNGSPGPVGACYTYDANGNLSTRVAAAGMSGSIQTTYTYDALDRVLTKSYSDGTPSVTYCYDGPCGGPPTAPAIGHLTSVSSSASGTSYTYDQLGRILSSTQTTGGQTYGPFSYTYNLADGLTQEKYPSGRTVSYFFDSAGRVMGVNGASAQYAGGACSSGQPDNCSNPIQYAPHGPISSMLMGNGVLETGSFNNRLQPLQIQAGSLLTLGFGYTAGQNNGNLASQVITRGSQSWTQNYAYDALNRLGGPSNTQGALQENGSTLQNYGYDQNGNWYLAYYDSSRISAPTIETPQSASWFLANNQINGWAYDAAGNETGIPASAGGTTRAACATNTMPGVAMLRTSCFDAENRMISETDVFGVTATYAYDGDGHRVSKNVNGAATTFVYDASGNLIAEYGGQNADTGTLYVSVDHLGSTRLLADASGAQKYCYDYLPFGGDLFAGTDGRPSCYPSAASSGIRFTGKERDAETGLDYFGARYMSGAQGRFTSPDPEIIPRDISDPQALNKYTYGLNNPLRYIDPDGAAAMDAGLVRIGTASFNVYRQQTSIDVAAQLVTAWPTQASQLVQPGEPWKPIWYPTQVSWEASQLGGCVAGCLSTFSAAPVGINVNVSFTYDDKTNAVTGANIGWSIDPTASFIGPNPAPTVNQFSPIPGQVPTTQAFGVNINASALKNLSPAQLKALTQSAANVPVAMIREAIQKALQQEQQRRANEEKKQEEKRRKHCQSGETGDCSPSGN